MQAKLSAGQPSNSGCCQGETFASQLKALGHPVRLGIVRQLMTRNDCCCGDFCASLPLAQSTVSQHLDVLCRAGLVGFEPDGNRSRYTLNRAAFKALAQAVGQLADEPEASHG